MSTTTQGGEQRVILQDVSWSTYVALTDDSDSRRKRISYYRGVMEIMAPSMPHEQVARLIGRMVEAFTEEMEIEICSVSSTTFRREDRQSGFEADESYYIGEVHRVLGKDKIDLTIDPPPDLVIEVDISRSSMRKFPLYGALGVPEIWCFNGEVLRFYVRSEADRYEEVATSSVLPQLSAPDLMRFLDQRSRSGETQIIRSFRQWVRERFGLTGDA